MQAYLNVIFSDWILTHIFNSVLLRQEQWIWLILIVFQNNLCPWKSKIVAKKSYIVPYTLWEIQHEAKSYRNPEQKEHWILPREFPKKYLHSSQRCKVLWYICDILYVICDKRYVIYHMIYIHVCDTWYIISSTYDKNMGNKFCLFHAFD